MDKKEQKKEPFSADWELPLRDAVKNILDGTPVPALEKVIEGCNRQFSEMNRSYVTNGYHPLLMIVTAFAQAENRILDGEDPAALYAAFEDSAAARVDCLKILQDYVQRGSSHIFTGDPIYPLDTLPFNPLALRPH